jgi:hypothetical protein
MLPTLSACRDPKETEKEQLDPDVYRLGYDDILRLNHTESLLNLESGRLASLMDELDQELACTCIKGQRPSTAAPLHGLSSACVTHTPTRTR